MQGERECTFPGRRSEDGDAVSTADVCDELPRAPSAYLGYSLDELGERVVGDGDEHQVGDLDHLVDRQQRDACQAAIGQAARDCGDARRGYDVVASPVQGRPKGAADAASPDYAYCQPPGAVCRARQSVHAIDPVL
jgi:hypothetical protein